MLLMESEETKIIPVGFSLTNPVLNSSMDSTANVSLFKCIYTFVHL